MKIDSNITEKEIRKWTDLGFWDRWSMCDYIKRYAQAFPNKDALIDSRKRLNWEEYGKYMDRMALHFLEIGIKAGDLVIAQLPNCVEAIIIQFALARIGACVIPLAMQWREHELQYVMEQAQPPAIIITSASVDFDYAALAKKLKEKNSCLKNIIVLGEEVSQDCVSFDKLWDTPIEEVFSNDYLDENFPSDPNEVFTLCYTSGTEADPKGCPRTHNHWKSFERSGFLSHLQANVNDRALMVIPWINLFGQSVCILSMAMTGGTLVMLDHFFPSTVAKTIEKEKITLYPAVPSMHRAVLNLKNIHSYNFSSLRVICTGGAPCPTTLIDKIMEVFGAQVWQGFGSNEGYLNVTEIGYEPDLISNTMGIRQLYSEIKIIDESGNKLGNGQVGEYCQRAPFIISGYYKRPDLNKLKWDDDGFYHTGDACFLDDNGYYHFVTRMSDFIIINGTNVSAEEIENILHKHPDIYDIAVIGVPNEVTGEKVFAFIQMQEGKEALTAKGVREFMKLNKVSPIKWPSDIKCVDRLPRTPTGKVTKYILRESLQEGLKH